MSLEGDFLQIAYLAACYFIAKFWQGGNDGHS
jgi:hypothetical protein